MSRVQLTTKKGTSFKCRPLFVVSVGETGPICQIVYGTPVGHLRRLSSSPPAASPPPDPGTSAPAAPQHFAGIARRVRRGKCEIANDSLASNVPLPPTPYESATIASPATAVEPTFDRSLCVETYPGMSLGPEIEAVLARVLEESKRAENSVQFIDCLLYTSPSPRD